LRAKRSNPCLRNPDRWIASSLQRKIALQFCRELLAIASVPDWLRYGAVAAGFVAFVLARKSIFAGVIAGEIVMLAGKYWLG
jgi:hypothetical protein